ncbi:MAG TPA: anti-sigma factor [Gemmatimonas sp.]|uniref:anti-sigma factor n=1 Tax=Gemmatimonas sp. TaxID=1962908 RepID=UPI002EDB6A8E
MTPFTIDDARALLPAFALDALDPPERQAMLDALQRFPELHAELDTFVKTVHTLGTSETVMPAPGLRDRFLQRLATADPDAPPTDAAPAMAASSGDRLQHRSTHRPSARRPLWRRVAPLLVTAALAATVVVLVRSQASLRNELDAARLAYTKGQSTIAERDQALAEKEAVLRTLLGGGDALLVVNMGVPNATGPGMQFFWNVKDGRGVLHAFRLPQTAQGRAYQLWLIRDGQPVPSRVFTPDGDGSTTLFDIELPQSTTGVTAVAVTEEPAGGSKLPTTQPFLVGTVSTRSQ